MGGLARQRRRCSITAGSQIRTLNEAEDSSPIQRVCSASHSLRLHSLTVFTVSSSDLRARQPRRACGAAGSAAFGLLAVTLAASASTLDVWAPKILSPKAGDVWASGERRTVTW